MGPERLTDRVLLRRRVRKSLGKRTGTVLAKAPPAFRESSRHIRRGGVVVVREG